MGDGRLAVFTRFVKINENGAVERPRRTGLARVRTHRDPDTAHRLVRRPERPKLAASHPRRQRRARVALRFYLGIRVQLLRFLSDPQLRPRTTAETNKVESYNRFSAWCRFGNAGVIADNDPDEQEKILTGSRADSPRVSRGGTTPPPRRRGRATPTGDGRLLDAPRPGDPRECARGTDDRRRGPRASRRRIVDHDRGRPRPTRQQARRPPTLPTPPPAPEPHQQRRHRDQASTSTWTTLINNVPVPRANLPQRRQSHNPGPR